MDNLNTEYRIPETSPELERGPRWLREKRHLARQSFNELPLPRRGLHLWRYTDPARFMFGQSPANTLFSDIFKQIETAERQRVHEGSLAAVVSDLGGCEIEVVANPTVNDSGAVITSLSHAVDTHLDLVRKYLYELVNEATGKFEAMNGALWNDGLFVYIPDNITIDQPIHLLREAGQAGSTQYPRLLVIVGRNAEVTIIDEYGGGASDSTRGQTYTNSAVEIFGLEDSRTNYVSLQRHGTGTHSYLTHRARILRGARMVTIPLVFGSLISKQNFGVILDGPGAQSNMYGLLFGSARQHLDNHTLHHHTHGQSQSNIDFKVVLRDRALSAYTGLIRIDKNARSCEAYQENRNLLLNTGTKAETIPELEILNDDVSCSHGATVGPIDPEILFYLTSRGIADEQAVRMIVSGFVNGTLNLVPENLRQRISDSVTARLKGI